MANNQPLNVDIMVKNRLRAQRAQPNAGLSVKQVANHMTALTVPVVGVEVLMSTKRSAAASITATALLAGRNSGLPLVRFVQAAMPFARNNGASDPVDGAANAMFDNGEIDFPFVIGGDKFMQQLDGAEGADLQGDLRAVTTPAAPTWQP